MWRDRPSRLRRRTLGPRARGSAADRAGLAVATAIVLAVGILGVVLMLRGIG
jgi:hypothetical protein